MRRSKDYIIINNDRNSNDYGLYIDTPLPPPRAKRRYSRIEVAGRDDIVTGTDTHEDVSYTITGYVFSDGKSFNNNRIYELFKDAKTLEISRYEGFYFKINEVEEIIPESSYDGSKVSYAITFSLAPFKYSLVPTESEISTAYTEVNNGGSAYIAPKIIIKMKKNTNPILKGDVNFDGVVNSKDASLVLKYFADPEMQFTEEQMIAADVNEDGVVDMRDAQKILEMYASSQTSGGGKPAQYVEIITNGASLFVGIPYEVINNGWAVTVDCDLHLIYYLDASGQKVSILHLSSLDLPLLHEGLNYIRYVGNNVESVKVAFSERWF